MVRAMVQGLPLPRPFLLPIVFSLGARLENLSLRAYLSNPTRMASALRQLRAVLALDGVTCYYDPYLEVEALGCEVSWNREESRPTLAALAADFAGLRDRLPSPEEMAQRGRIPVACDVIRRLKLMLPGEPALASAVTGPYALATLLTEGPKVATEALEFAAQVAAAVCQSFLDAGASVIFLREDVSEVEDYSRWADLMSPVVNVIRFYEAAPVLQPCNGSSPAANEALGAACNGLICPGEIDPAGGVSRQAREARAAFLPIPDLLAPEASGDALPAILRSSGSDSMSFFTREDIAADTDIKRLANLFKSLQSPSRVGA